MATRALQENIHFPLLLELATYHSGDKVGVEREGDYRHIRDIIKTLYADLPDEYTSQTVGNRTPKLRNDILFAKKQLEESADITVRPWESWEITEKGILKLRAQIHQLLSRADESELIQVLSHKGANAEDGFVIALQGLSEDDLVELRFASSSYVEFFLQSIGRLSPESVVHWSVDAYELIQELMVKYHVRPFWASRFHVAGVIS